MNHAPTRCPRCAALVAPRAPWCTLCYADLRPVVEPAQDAVPGALAAPRAGRHRSAEVVGAAAGDLLVRPRRAAAPTADRDAETGAPGWPCRGCGGQVPLARDACQICGAGFLDLDAAAVTVRLPWVGDLLAMSRARRAALGGVAAAALGLLLLLLATVLGLVV